MDIRLALWFGVASPTVEWCLVCKLEASWKQDGTDVV